MLIVEVIPSRRWRHGLSGRTASIYGAVPWVDPADEINWSIQIRGWTWRLDNGTVGLGRMPAKTRAEAEQVMAAFNARQKAL